MTPREIILRLTEMVIDAEVIYYNTPSSGPAHLVALDELMAIHEAFDAATQAYGLAASGGALFSERLREHFAGLERQTSLRAREILVGVGGL